MIKVFCTLFKCNYLRDPAFTVPLLRIKVVLTRPRIVTRRELALKFGHAIRWALSNALLNAWLVLAWTESIGILEKLYFAFEAYNRTTRQYFAVSTIVVLARTWNSIVEFILASRSFEGPPRLFRPANFCWYFDIIRVRAWTRGMSWTIRWWAFLALALGNAPC